MGKRDRIERLHLVDLDVALSEGEVLDDVCAELTIGLLVQHSVLIEGAEQWPVVRFTGPRSQLEELLNRYDGVRGAFAPASVNPDAPIHTDDPEFRRTMIGS